MEVRQNLWRVRNEPTADRTCQQRNCFVFAAFDGVDPGKQDVLERPCLGTPSGRRFSEGQQFLGLVGMAILLERKHDQRRCKEEMVIVGTFSARNLEEGLRRKLRRQIKIGEALATSAKQVHPACILGQWFEREKGS